MNRDLAYWTKVARPREANRAWHRNLRRTPTGTHPKLPTETRRTLSQQLAKTLAYEQAGKRAAAKLWGQKLTASIRALFGDGK